MDLIARKHLNMEKSEYFLIISAIFHSSLKQKKMYIISSIGMRLGSFLGSIHLKNDPNWLSFPIFPLMKSYIARLRSVLLLP